MEAQFGLGYDGLVVAQKLAAFVATKQRSGLSNESRK